MKTFSAYWTDKLGKAIDEASKRPYRMEFHAGSHDFESLRSAVNQGIDSYLTAIRFTEFTNQTGRRGFELKPTSVGILVRRLLETGDDNDMSLASGICQTLGIELV